LRFPRNAKKIAVTSLTVDIATTPHALEITLTATLGIPFLVLVVDYVSRIDTGILQTMRNSGPDLCLLGLGSVGSIFLDQKVASAFFIPPVLAGTIVVLLIILLRGVCFRLQKKLETTNVAIATMITGLASIFIVGGVLVYGYIR
jgi:hypothetical protein